MFPPKKIKDDASFGQIYKAVFIHYLLHHEFNLRNKYAFIINKIREILLTWVSNELV